MKIAHLMYVPWTGLGLYGGFRGNRWLRNRIQIFKQFVVPSLQAQTSDNFVLVCSWRYEERNNPLVRELVTYLEGIKEFRTIHTFAGILFWDDKYPDEVARERLLMSLQGSLGELANVIGDVDYVLMTIQPSDDCYCSRMVKDFQQLFADNPEVQALGFRRGYVANYRTLDVAEYNPTTIPPFFTIKFPKEIFLDPLKHAEYTGPYKSHEYIGDKLNLRAIKERGFLVGTHGENISTVFNHPFKGRTVEREALKEFGLYDVAPLKVRLSVRKWLLRKLPHQVQRKLRYLFGERLFQRIYEFIRS